MSIESNILRELGFNGIISDFAVQKKQERCLYIVIVHLCYCANTIVFSLCIYMCKNSSIVLLLFSFCISA